MIKLLLSDLPGAIPSNDWPFVIHHSLWYTQIWLTLFHPTYLVLYPAIINLYLSNILCVIPSDDPPGYLVLYQTIINPLSSNLLGAILRDDCLFPDSKVHGANMGPTWVLSAPDGPHVGPMNLAIRVFIRLNTWCYSRHWLTLWFSTYLMPGLVIKVGFWVDHVGCDISRVAGVKPNIGVWGRYAFEIHKWRAAWTRHGLILQQENEDKTCAFARYESILKVQI